MQRAGGEGCGQEERGAILNSQVETEGSQLDESDATGENRVQKGVPAREEIAPQLPLALHLSTLKPLEDEEDEETLRENDKDEFLVLDADHPLIKRHQVALKSKLSKWLERLNLQLKEKLDLEKADTSYLQEMGVEVFKVQERLATHHARLEARHLTKLQAEARHQQAQDQLEAARFQHSSATSIKSKARANVSQLQAELDNLMVYVRLTQGASEDLRSNVKAMKNTTHKAGAEKTLAEEQKLQQDMYVERLTKDLERLTQQVAMYDAQIPAQAEETQTATEALTEAEMEMESLIMVHKQLLQHWNSSLADVRKRDEAFSTMQEAERMAEHQVILLDREIEGYKKSIMEEQEGNEILTMQLNWSQMDIITSKKLLGQKQTQQEALQTNYNTCLRTLQETECTLARLIKETSAHEAELKDQRQELEKERDVHLELEDRIMNHIQQKLTHNKAAKYSEQLTNKIASLKKEKVAQLWKLESEVAAAGLEGSVKRQNLDSLALIQKALHEDIKRNNKLVTSNEAKIASFVTLIRQKQTTITNYNNKIHQIAASTGHEDLSPLHIKAEALTAQLEEMVWKIRSDQQLWVKWQGALEGLTQSLQANSKDMHKLQAEFTLRQQKNIRLESEVELEHREAAELEKNTKILQGDLLKLNTLLSMNGQLSQALKQENTLMETDFLHRLKEAERESVEMQLKHEKARDDKESLLNSLIEAERQIMLWDKKIKMAKETRSVVDSKVGDIQMMKAEIHRMEVRFSQLMKEQEWLLRKSEAAVERREHIAQRWEATVHNSHRHTTKGELNRIIQGVQRKIQQTHKHLAECEKEVKELEESQEGVRDRIEQQKQQLNELHSTSHTLDTDILNLKDIKVKNLDHLLALQSRNKKLQDVCDGSYKASSTSESVGAALQRKMERVYAIHTIIHRVLEEFPHHQGTLHRLSLALAAYTELQGLNHQ
ncbi:coiled-coil domain-containing protein 40 [Aulostomus maculatus]